MSQSHRFVILSHDHPMLHWDLMLDTGDVLRTWRIESEPQLGVQIRAVALPDHRRMYLEYEGPISGDRGTVSRWDLGKYKVLEESPTHVTIQIDGVQVSGVAELVKLNRDDEWRFVLRGSSNEG